jgi:hypothetical protein
LNKAADIVAVTKDGNDGKDEKIVILSAAKDLCE